MLSTQVSCYYCDRENTDGLTPGEHEDWKVETTVIFQPPRTLESEKWSLGNALTSLEDTLELRVRTPLVAAANPAMPTRAHRAPLPQELGVKPSHARQEDSSAIVSRST